MKNQPRTKSRRTEKKNPEEGKETFSAPNQWALFLALLALDQVSKALMRQLPLGTSVTVVPGAFWLTHVENTGASFSLFQGANTLLIWVAILFLGLLLYYQDTFRTRIERIFLLFLFAGVVGNLLDRILFGRVTDLFDLGWFPVFNVADACLNVGVFGLILYELLWKRKK